MARADLHGVHNSRRDIYARNIRQTTWDTPVRHEAIGLPLLSLCGRPATPVQSEPATKSPGQVGPAGALSQSGE